ncbi:MAG: RNA recognition motif domain-containing protein [Bryobacteraceae bacterium]
MSATVFLGNLPPWVTADDIKAWLVAENLVADAVKVIRNPETQESKGFAFIEAPNEEEMHLIIKRFDRAPLEDRLLRANPAQPPKSRSGPPVPRRETPHFSAPSPRAPSASTPASGAAGSASGAATGSDAGSAGGSAASHGGNAAASHGGSAAASHGGSAMSAPANGHAMERNRRGGKKHARRAQTPQTLFAEELAKAL